MVVSPALLKLLTGDIWIVLALLPIALYVIAHNWSAQVRVKLEALK